MGKRLYVSRLAAHFVMTQWMTPGYTSYSGGFQGVLTQVSANQGTSP